MGEFWDMVEDGLICEESGEFIGRIPKRRPPPGGWTPKWKIRTPGKVECKICGDRWFTNLARHNMEVHPELPPPEGYTRCSDCGVIFNSKRLKRHRRKYHDEE